MATSTLGSGTLVLAGTTSGTTTVTATAVAGTTTLTLPAATDTLVGKATTDTLTNKTLTGAVMNGTLGATTPSTVAATTLTTSSTVTHNGGTANGVPYLDGSKVLTTGSALVFDGTNLGVGTSSPAKKLQINSSDTTDGIRLYCSDTGGENLSIVWQSALGSNRITGDIKSNASGAGGNFILRTANTSAVLTEALRVDNAQNLLVGATSAPSATVRGVQISSDMLNYANIISAGTSTSTFNMLVFNNGNGQVGAITTNGSATTYATASDYRLKNTIAPITGAIAKVLSLKPVAYKWNADGSDGEGFIAHELAEVCPDAVVGEKDAVDADGNPKYQGIDTSFLVAILTAAIQEQQALITQLAARITALEGA